MPSELKNTLSAIMNNIDSKKTSRLEGGGTSVLVWTVSGIVLAACGGGGGGSSSVSPSPPPPEGDGNSEVYVMDGPIIGAAVYFDINDDGEVTDDERAMQRHPDGRPRYITDEEGKVDVPVSIPGTDSDSDYSRSAFVAVVDNAIDTSTGAVLSGEFKSLANGRGGVASPLTDLLYEIGGSDAILQARLDEIFSESNLEITLDDVLNPDNYKIIDAPTEPSEEGGETSAEDTANYQRDMKIYAITRAALALTEIDQDSSLLQQNVQDTPAARVAALSLLFDDDNPDAGNNALENRVDERQIEGGAINDGKPLAAPDRYIFIDEDEVFDVDDYDVESREDPFGFLDPARNDGVVSLFQGIYISSTLEANGQIRHDGDALTGDIPVLGAGAPDDDDRPDLEAGETFYYIPSGGLSGIEIIPDENYSGILEVDYFVFDGEQFSDRATLRIRVNEINDPPMLTELSGDRDSSSSSHQYVIGADGYIVDPNGARQGEVEATDEESGNLAIGNMTLAGADGDQFELINDDGNTIRLKLRDTATPKAAGETYSITIILNDGVNTTPPHVFTLTQGGLYIQPSGSLRTYSNGAGLLNEEANGSEEGGAIIVGVVGIEGRATDGIGEAGDDNYQSAITYEVITGDFDINVGNLRYTGSDSGDFEEGDSLNVRIRATWQDNSGEDRVESFDYVVNLRNIDDQPPVFSTPADGTGSRSVREDATGVIYTAQAADIEGDAVTYDIDDASKALFEIGTNSGAISLRADQNLDHESVASHTITVTASSTTFTTNATVTINVTDVNEAPEIELQSVGAVTAAGVAAAGNQGLEVAEFILSDPDGGNIITPSLIGQHADLFSFENDGGTRFKLYYTGQAGQVEDGEAYDITIRASDGSLSSQVDPNIIEGGLFVTIDDPANAGQTINVFSGDTVNRLLPEKLNIVTHDDSVTIPGTSERGFLLGILGDSCGSTSFMINPDDSNSVSNFYIHSDSSDVHRLYYIGADSGDFENGDFRTVDIIASDDSDDDDSDDTVNYRYTVNLLNVDDNAPEYDSATPSTNVGYTTQGGFTLTTAENGPLMLGTIVANDPDGDTVTFTLLPDTHDNNLFSITADGVLSFNSGENSFENGDGNGQFRVEVTMRSTSSLMNEEGGVAPERDAVQIVNVHLTDVNEAPTAIVVQNSSGNVVNVLGSGHTIVGILSATDEDTNSTYMFELTSDTSALDNERFEITEDNGIHTLVLTGGRQDPGHVYNVRIMLTDGEHELTQTINFIEGGVFLEVDGVKRYSNYTDDDDNGLLAENIDAAGMISLGTPGSDRGEDFEVRLAPSGSTNDNDEFEINDDDELIYTGDNSGNFETGDVKRVEFEVSGDGLAIEQIYRIRLADVDDAPDFPSSSDPESATLGMIVSGSGSASVVNNIVLSDILFTAKTPGPEGNDISIEIEVGTDQGEGVSGVEVDGNEITIRLRADGARVSLIETSIESSEADDLISVDSFNNGVARIRNSVAPTNLTGGTLPSTEVDEDVSDSHVFHVFDATDADGDVITYEITNDDSNLFDVDEETGALTLKNGAQLDHETTTAYDVEVTATSTGFGQSPKSASTTFRVNVRNVNESPTGVTISRATLLPEETEVGTLDAIDADAENDFAFSLTENGAGVDNDRFEIDGTTLNFIGSERNEAGVPYVIEVRVVDGEFNITQILHIVDGGAFLTVELDEGGTAQRYSGYTDAEGNGLLVENMSGDGSDPIILGLFGHQTSSEFSVELVADDDDNDNAEFMISANQLLYIGTDSGDFESETGSKRIELEFTFNEGDADEETVTEIYIVNLADADDAPVFTNPVPYRQASLSLAVSDAETPSLPDVVTEGGDITFISKLDGVAGNSTRIYILRVNPTDETHPDYGEGVSDITVIGSLVIITLRREGATLDQIKEAIDTHDPMDADDIAASDILDVIVAEDRGDEKLVVPPSASNDDILPARPLTGGAGASVIANPDENVSDSTVLFTVQAFDADGDIISYAITDDASGMFEIDENSGEISLIEGEFLNYEDATSHEITITATSTGTGASPHTIEITRQINVLDVEIEGPATIRLSRQALSPESTSAGILTVIDDDSDADEITVTLEDGVLDNDLFEIQTTGSGNDIQHNLVFVGEDETESQTTPGQNGRKSAGEIYRIEVTAEDEGDREITRQITIAESDVSFSSAAMINVDEERQYQTTDILYTAAVDDDGGDTITWSLEGADAELFTISSSGQVSFSSPTTTLDYDNPSLSKQYDITVVATLTDSDGTMRFGYHDVAIQIENVNDNPAELERSITGDPILVDGDITVDTRLYSVTDGDFYYTATDIDGGDAEVRFREDDGTFALTYSNDGVNFRLESEDVSGETRWYIYVLADSAPLFHGSTSAGTRTVPVVAMDGGEGKEDPDGAPTPTPTSLLFTLRDVQNEDPEFTSEEAIEVDEDAQGVIYTAVAAPDVTGDTVTYGLEEILDHALFTIDSQSGEVSVIGDPFDAESGTTDYSFRVTATVAATPNEPTSVARTAGYTVQISIVSVDEGFEFDAGDSIDVEVEEGSSAIYTPSFTIDTGVDPDGMPFGVGRTIEFALSGADATSFDIDSSTGQVTLASGVELDFESDKTEYDIIITGTPSSGPVANRSQTVRIIVTDDPADNPITSLPSGIDTRNGNDQSNTINGDSDAELIQGVDGDDIITSGGGADILVGGADDDTITLDDGAQTIIYRFNSDTPTRFGGTDGTDTISNFRRGVDKLVLVDVGNNDPITNLGEFIDRANKPDVAFELNENMDMREAIFSFGTDIDGAATLRISFDQDGPLQDFSALDNRESDFDYDPEETVNADIDPELENFDLLADLFGGGNSIVIQADDTLADGIIFNSSIQFSSASMIDVEENTQGVIHTVVASSVLTGQISYDLALVGDYQSFTINSTTGVISVVGSPFNFEGDQQSYSLSVTATRAASGNNPELTVNQDVTINITDVNEAPTAIIINDHRGAPVTSIRQGVSRVGQQLTTEDEDVYEYIFELTDDTESLDNELFELQQNESGTYSLHLIGEHKNVGQTYNVRIRVIDNGPGLSTDNLMFEQTLSFTQDGPIIDLPQNIDIRNGNDQPNTINGDSDAELIRGGAGDDAILSGGGADIIIGGEGDDTITLGEGAQTIIYQYDSDPPNLDGVDDNDTISNFRRGVDKLVFIDVGNDDPTVDLVHYFSRILGEGSSVTLDESSNIQSMTLAFRGATVEEDEMLVINFDTDGPILNFNDIDNVADKFTGSGDVRALVDVTVLSELLGGENSIDAGSDNQLPVALAVPPTISGGEAHSILLPLGGTTIYTASGTPELNSDSIVWSLDDDDSQTFDIDPNTGVVTLESGESLDASGHTIVIRAIAGAAPPAIQTLTININEPPAITISDVSNVVGSGTLSAPYRAFSTSISNHHSPLEDQNADGWLAFDVSDSDSQTTFTPSSFRVEAVSGFDGNGQSAQNAEAAQLFSVVDGADFDDQQNSYADVWLIRFDQSITVGTYVFNIIANDGLNDSDPVTFRAQMTAATSGSIGTEHYFEEDLSFAELPDFGMPDTPDII